MAKRASGGAGPTAGDLDQAVADIESGAIVALRSRLAAQRTLAVARLPDEDTLLHVACHRKLAAAVEALLEAGADANARGFFGKTPMHAAVNDTDAARAAPIVRLLMTHGADLTRKDDAGFTAVDWARQEVWDPQDEVLELLAAPRAAEPPPTGDDPLAVAAQMRAIEKQSHTELAVFQRLEAYAQKKTGAAAGLRSIGPKGSAALPAADAQVLGELDGILAAVDATSLSPTLKAWLKEVLTPALVKKMMATYWSKH